MVQKAYSLIFRVSLFLHKLFFFLFNRGYPFGNRIWAKKEKYIEIFEESEKKKFLIIDEFEKKNSFSINKKWLNNLALKTQVVIKKTPINYQHGRVIYSELMSYIKKRNIKNFNILETGSARGFSSICLSRALIDSHVKGKIYSIDILPVKKKIYWNCISDLEGKKSRKELLKDWDYELKNINYIQGKSKDIFSKIDLKRIHFSFLDGSHNFKDVSYEFDWISKRQIKGDIIIFDDYNSKKFDGVVKCVDNIRFENIYKLSFIYSENDRYYVIATKE
jgi:predicted O-methyltransferase YrrM